MELFHVVQIIEYLKYFFCAPHFLLIKLQFCNHIVPQIDRPSQFVISSYSHDSLFLSNAFFETFPENWLYCMLVCLSHPEWLFLYGCRGRDRHTESSLSPKTEPDQNWGQQPFPNEPQKFIIMQKPCLFDGFLFCFALHNNWPLPPNAITKRNDKLQQQAESFYVHQESCVALSQCDQPASCMTCFLVASSINVYLVIFSFRMVS